jgi:hypothetical protein
MSRQQCELRHKEQIFWRVSDIKADLAPVQPHGILSRRREVSGSGEGAKISRQPFGVFGEKEKWRTRFGWD